MAILSQNMLSNNSIASFLLLGWFSATKQYSCSAVWYNSYHHALLLWEIRRHCIVVIFTLEIACLNSVTFSTIYMSGYIVIIKEHQEEVRKGCLECYMSLSISQFLPLFLSFPFRFLIFGSIYECCMPWGIDQFLSFPVPSSFLDFRFQNFRDVKDFRKFTRFANSWWPSACILAGQTT